MSAQTVDQAHKTLIQQLGLHLGPANETEYCRFSESPLWSLQRQYYSRASVNNARRACLERGTASSPLLAEHYADIILAYWEDALQSGQLDCEKPVYVLEAGAGGGVFSFYMVNQLQLRLQHSPLNMLNWILIASDMVQQNLDFIRHHPKTFGHVSAGRLDTLCFDVEANATRLVSDGGVDLSRLDNPLVVIANGVFSSLTQDVFHIHYGKLFEGMISLESSDQRKVEQEPLRFKDPFAAKQKKLENPFADLVINYQWQKVGKLDWLDSDCQVMMDNYIQRLDSTCLQVPTGAINCLDKILELTTGRCLVLATDYGHADEQDLRFRPPPQLWAHGEFTLPVNFHLLDQLVQARGGLSWFSNRRNQDDLVSSAFLFAEDSGYFGNTQQQVYASFSGLDAVDYRNLHLAFTSAAAKLSATQILACLKLSRNDIQLLFDLLPDLLEKVDDIYSGEHSQWCDILDTLWAQYLPLGCQSDKVFELGRLAVELNHWRLARDVFNFLARSHGANKAVNYHLALIELHTGDEKSALQLLERNKGIDPGCELNNNLYHAVRDYCVRTKELPWYFPESVDPVSLSLRPLSEFDAPAIYYQYRDPAIAVLTRLPGFTSIENVYAWVREQVDKSNEAIYAVYHRELGFIGIVDLHYIENTAYFYFWIGSDFQNRGFGQQAARLALKQAGLFGLTKLFTSAYRDNWRSLHALQRIGFQLLPVAAREPDEELVFLHADLQGQRGHAIKQVGKRTDQRELAEFLRDIESPIKLEL